jgi:hypothetical protein
VSRRVESGLGKSTSSRKNESSRETGSQDHSRSTTKCQMRGSVKRS